MGVKYVSQRFTLTLENVPTAEAENYIEKFSPSARSGGPTRPPSIVEYKGEVAKHKNGHATVTMTFIYQCYCGGSGKAMIYRFAQALIKRMNIEGVTAKVTPGEILETRPPRDAKVNLTPTAEAAQDLETELEVDDDDEDNEDDEESESEEELEQEFEQAFSAE